MTDIIILIFLMIAFLFVGFFAIKGDKEDYEPPPDPELERYRDFSKSLIKILNETNKKDDKK